MHPSQGTVIEDSDHDGVKDRMIDITFLDTNSHYDENVLNTYIDYITIVEEIGKMAKSYIEEQGRINNFENAFETLLKSKETKSRAITEKPRR